MRSLFEILTDDGSHGQFYEVHVRISGVVKTLRPRQRWIFTWLILRREDILVHRVIHRVVNELEQWVRVISTPKFQHFVHASAIDQFGVRCQVVVQIRVEVLFRPDLHGIVVQI